jgi:4-hydroxythreonine-4-phosphate dehydrogenase
MSEAIAIPRIGITLGDLHGVGPEVILKTVQENLLTDLCTPIVFGSSKVMSFYRKVLNTDPKFQFHLINQASEAHVGKVNLVQVWKDEVNLEPGVKSPEAGAYALMSLKAGMEALKEGSIDALVTAPVNKDNIQLDDNKPFTGHTEFLAEGLGGEALMILASGNLRVALATGHIPVAKVAGALNRELLLKRISQLHRALLEDFGIRRPRIAVLGLNPHAGDQGLLGDEEIKIIGPAVEEVFRTGKLVYGPFPADGFFGSGTYEAFDGVLAMYHDQGLAPFKALSFGSGVNITAGLTGVRTSPDHGTAFDIAGKGEADPESFRMAVYAAIDVWRKRSEYREISANPLPQGKQGQRE